jgi:hypothetical protein
MSQYEIENLIADLHDDNFQEDAIFQILLALDVDSQTAIDALNNEPGFW